MYIGFFGLVLWCGGGGVGWGVGGGGGGGGGRSSLLLLLDDGLVFEVFGGFISLLLAWIEFFFPLSKQ